jgi:hypothetical protein
MGAAGDCKDYTDAQLLMDAYTTSVKEKSKGGGDQRGAEDEEEGEDGKSLDVRATATQRSIAVTLKPGERIPSYTDRVLVHTLPGKEADIRAGSYELCDELVCSDHRPVVSVFEILLDERVVRGGGRRQAGFECVLSMEAEDLKVR